MTVEADIEQMQVVEKKKEEVKNMILAVEGLTSSRGQGAGRLILTDRCFMCGTLR